MNRLLKEANGEWKSGNALDHLALRPEQIKKRRIDNACLRRAVVQKSEEKRPKLSEIDDFDPPLDLRPWLGPTGAEFFRLVAEEEDEAKQ